MMKNPYLKNLKFTATPEELILKCYEKLVYHLNQAFEFFDNVSTRNESLNLAKDIILELQNSINDKYDQDVAKNLNNAYDVMINLLYQSLIHKDKKSVSLCLDMAQKLKKSWAMVIESKKNE